MKRRSLFLLLALTLGSLAGCNTSKTPKAKEPEVPEFTNEDYRKSIEMDSAYQRTNHKYREFKETADYLPEGYKYLEPNEIDLGVARVINDAGYVGVYNVLHKKFILNCQYSYKELLNTNKSNKITINSLYRDDNDQEIYITLIHVLWDDVYTIYDNVGNLLYSGKYNKDLEYGGRIRGFKEDTYKVEIKTPDGIIIKIYDKNGKMYDFSDEEVKYNFDIQNTYEVMVDLEFAGKPGWKSYVTNQVFTTYDENNNVVISKRHNYYDDQISYAGFVGKYYYTVLMRQGYRGTNENWFYSYETRAIAEINRYNLITGEKDVITPAIIPSSSTPMYKDGKLTPYSMINGNVIKDHKLSTASLNYIVDEDFNIVANGKIQINNLRKNGNYYINYSNNCVYDENFNYLYSHSGSSRFIDDKEIYRKNGFVGIRTLNGEQFEPTIYDEIYAINNSNVYVTSKQGVIEVKYWNKNVVHKLEDIQRVNSNYLERYGLFELNDYESNKYKFDLYGNMFEFNLKPYSKPRYFVNDGLVETLVKFGIRNEGDTKYFLYEANESTKITTHGREVLKAIDINTLYSPFEIKIGENNILKGTPYLKLDATRDGFYDMGDLRYNLFDVYKLVDNKLVIYNPGTFNTSLLLQAGTYYFYALPAKDDFVLNITFNEFNELGNAVDKITITENYNDFFVQVFVPTYDGVYSLNSEAELQLITLPDDNNFLTDLESFEIDGEKCYVLEKGHKYYIVTCNPSAYEVRKPKLMQPFNPFTVINDEANPFTYNLDTNTYTSSLVNPNDLATISLKLNSTICREVTVEITNHTNGDDMLRFEHAGAKYDILNTDVPKRYSFDISKNKTFEFKFSYFRKTPNTETANFARIKLIVEYFEGWEEIL